MNFKLVVEVTYEELVKNYAEAVKTELGRDVEVKCIDAPISVGKVQSTEETADNTPVEAPKKTAPKKRTQAKKKEPDVSETEITKPWVDNPEYISLKEQLQDVLDKMDKEKNCFTPEYEKLSKKMDELNIAITSIIDSYKSEESLAKLHTEMFEVDKLENTPTDTTDSESEEDITPTAIPERNREIPEDEVAPWEDKKEEEKPKSLDELFPHRNDPSAPGLFSQFARKDSE